MGKRTHGMGSRQARPPEYVVWCNMRQRCDDPRSKDYPNYGGRGIVVCPQWYDFAAFYEGMGERPSAEHSIDRIDVNGNYEPANCRWATRSEQNRNRRPRRPATHCKRGHPFSGDNLYVRRNGKRACKACRRDSLRAFYVRKRESA